MKAGVAVSGEDRQVEMAKQSLWSRQLWKKFVEKTRPEKRQYWVRQPPSENYCLELSPPWSRQPPEEWPPAHADQESQAERVCDCPPAPDASREVSSDCDAGSETPPEACAAFSS